MTGKLKHGWEAGSWIIVSCVLICVVALGLMFGRWEMLSAFTTILLILCLFWLIVLYRAVEQCYLMLRALTRVFLEGEGTREEIAGALNFLRGQLDG